MTNRVLFPSAHNALHRMHTAYAAGDIGELAEAYRAAPEASTALRLATRLIEAFYPLGPFLDFAVLLDRCLGDGGLRDGSRRFLDEAGVSWRSVLPHACRKTAEEHPVLLFGNHSSLLTPFFAAASLERDDLRCFTTNYICRLVPNFGRLSFPLEVPLHRTGVAWRQGGPRRAIAHRLASIVHQTPDPATARTSNRNSLDLGAAHIRRGGSAIIHPGGGGTKERRWYPGLGSLVKRLHEVPGERPAYLIPIHETNCTNHRIHAQLMRGPIARLKRAVVYRGPARIRFGEPIAVRDVASSTSTAEQIVAWLRIRYETMFAEPEPAAA